MNNFWKILWTETESHLPYSAFATAAGILVAGIMLYVAMVVTQSRSFDAHEPSAAAAFHEEEHLHDDAHATHEEEGEHLHDDAHATHEHGHGHDHDHQHDVLISASKAMEGPAGVTFHMFHPIHMLFSAVATTAMFWRYKRKLLLAVITGLVGSLGVCSLSDVFMPYLSGLLLGAGHMHFHWCLIEHPQMVLPFTAVGIACGILAPRQISNSTQFSHSSHIFVSVIASLFYLITFGVTNWMDENVFASVFFIVVLCVSIPCCLSDVIFPCLTVSCGGSFCHAGTHAGHEHAQDRPPE